MEHISVTDPIGLAIERVRQVLFRPFDLGKWFAIGFCAWLAGLGERGFGGHANFGGGSDQHRGDVHQQFEHARAYVLQNLVWIVPLAIFLIALSLAFWVLFLWLNSRGKFMFLHNVALNRADVVGPWNRFAEVAQSLFWFRLALGLIGMVIILPLLMLMVLSVVPMFVHDSWNFAGIFALICLFLGMMLISLCFMLVHKLTVDFVVPIMFLRGTRCLAAWKEFWQLLVANVGHFALYFLFQIVIAIAVGAMVMLAIIVTCCIAACLLAIPFIGTILFLPVILFKRAYSLYYFAQYGPAYDVFRPATMTAV